MVEFGKVKFFDDREGKHYGFLMVVDADDNPTGEEIFFHYNDGKFISCHTFYDRIARRGNESIRLKVPRKLDKLVFERQPGRKGDKACPWSFANEWDVIRWRVVREDYYIEPYQEEPGSTTFCDSGSSYKSTVRNGSTTADLEVVSKWTGADVGLYDDEQDEPEGGGGFYDGANYWLQVIRDGNWTRVGIVKPARDAEDDEVDDVSRAEYEYGKAHEMYS